MKNSKQIFIVKFIFSLIFLLLPVYVLSVEAYVSVTDAAKKLKLELFWEPVSQEIIFKKNNAEASCKVGQSLVVFNNPDSGYFSAEFYTAPYTKDGLTFVTEGMFSKLQTFFSLPEKERLYSVGAILIDPGHGGKDPGCVGSYEKNGKNFILYEKDIALKVSLELYSMLKKIYPDKRILLTRDKDFYPTLEDRVNTANKVKLNKNESILYVSVHANAAPNVKASGFEVWYLPSDYRREVLDKNEAPKEIHSILNSMMEEEFTTESVLLAQSILDGLDGQIGSQSKKRGIRANPYFVIRKVKMPSVLVEIGFVTNKEEAKLLASPAYLKKCSMGIYNGITAFISGFENGIN
ncbi:N-acetylmuramoyl-L-alanine amidase [Treponema pedis]|nr:N-acetylmuramoyl-L-alanine amidase [Treponema pedis]